jgi:2Fe-2S ferredoxin
MAGFLRTEKRRNAKAVVTILPSGRTVRVARGASLLDAVLMAGEGLAHPCGGRAQCGSCHVVIREGCRGLSKIRREELDQLARLEGTMLLSRLACQAVLGTHDVTIQLISH